MNENINYLAFEPRKWQADKNHSNAERTMITDMCGGLTEVFCLGDWHKNWSQINSPNMLLKKNTDYVFTFWLNGGENDRFKETCKLKIYFQSDSENPIIFKLNRSYIKPIKYNSGWYRYEIPFNSGDSNGESVAILMQFAAMDAHCAIMPDKPEFDSLPDEDLPDSRIPQRHNIVFSEGYPRDAHWSHLVFGEDSNYRNPFHQSSSLASLIAEGFDLNMALEDLPPQEKADVLMKIL
ncbi:MAG: hypothetical protein FWF81_14335 [Defluviitaleaceae bacterium]|nr:hypothetical protein [Defluviitaleaceae bacterium]